MRMSFRWFGRNDPVPLKHIRQIPGVRGIVSALYDVPVGETWPRKSIARLIDEIGEAGMPLSVVESIPVHEDIKLGRPDAARLLDQYAESVRNIGEAGVGVLCYNFMPVFDWTRTNLAMALPDGSTALAYDDDQLAKIDLSHGTRDLPGWAAAHDAGALSALLDSYRASSTEQLWESLSRFLEHIVPIAEEYGVKLAIHPDDPPWPIFGIPRIITSESAIDRVLGIADSPANGITFCTGSLGASADNDLPAMARKYGKMQRVHFVHCRNVQRTSDRSFNEVPHPTEFGDVNVLDVLGAFVETGFDGPMRPDHGRMIWGETGRPGYGLYDRALGATYLYGMWEALSSFRT
jgi:mannonate dehydratase